jgi:DNA-binding HxlR family transcriptional regulator
MTQIKENSTWNFNKELSMQACPVSFVMNKIGGHWKPIILYQLMSGPIRYSELRRAIPGITEKMLIQHLKQLQADDLVSRKAEAVVPPHVVYQFTAKGDSLKPVLKAIAAWGYEQWGEDNS